jgi:predicted small metal-binding protein
MTQSDPEYHHVLQCPCGTSLSGDTEDEIVEVAFAHLRERHPDMADDYEREHILFMAIKVPK